MNGLIVGLILFGTGVLGIFIPEFKVICVGICVGMGLIYLLEELR